MKQSSDEKKSKIREYNKWYNSQPHVLEYRKNKQAQRRERPEERKKHNERERLRMSDTRYRFKRILAQHGISAYEFAWMLHGQQFKCIGCSELLRLDKETHIDHCHSSGVVRGILCQHCNLILGHAKDRPEVLVTLAAYLERYKGAEAVYVDGKLVPWEPK